VKNVFISGSTKGIGKAIALQLSKKNFNVFLHGRSKKDLQQVANLIKYQENKKIKSIVADFLKEKDLKKVSNFLKKNSIEIIINNAGEYYNSNIFNTSTQRMKDLFQVNFFSIFTLIKDFVKWKKDNFIIINLNSFAGKNSSKNEIVYAATKNALRSLSNSLKQEFIGKKIKIIDLFLGAVKSRMTKNRKNFNKLIDPGDIAEFVSDVITKYSSLQVSDVDIFKN
jgi:short-subunit dehydrogenase